MFWSPNNADVSSLYQWFPRANSVDIVGIDICPASGQAGSFSEVYQIFFFLFLH